MNVQAMRTFIGRHRIPLMLGAAVAGLMLIAVILAVNVIGQARDLTAGEVPSASPSPEATPPPSEEPTPDPTATPDPTPEPTPPPTPGPIAAWELAATFGDADDLQGVHDIAAWNGGFYALGEAWDYNDAGGLPDPRMWSSADGRSWSEVSLDLVAGSSVDVLAPLPDGRLMILGRRGGDVSFWSEPAKAAAWATSDGVTWDPVPLPFATTRIDGPIQFAAGLEGIVATVDDEIWQSSDGESWRKVYDAPRGWWVYEAVAGDEGWIVKQTSASLGTTVILVSGDAVTWHEVELGNVGTVSSVAGDWLVTSYGENGETIEILRSENGLDWEAVLDLDDLDGESRNFQGATLAGTADMTVLSPWQGGHCFSMPAGEGVWWSSDGGPWTNAGLIEGAVVTHAIEVGEVSVLTGYLAGSGGVAFWVNNS
jgi:hypothetical protein